MAFKPLCRQCMHWHWPKDPCIEERNESVAEMERRMDAGEWDYDEDGNVVPRESVTQPYVNPQCLNDNAPCAPDGEGNCVACDRVFGDSVTSNSVTQ